jgi:hypothetical protein
VSVGSGNISGLMESLAGGINLKIVSDDLLVSALSFTVFLSEQDE